MSNNPLVVTGMDGIDLYANVQDTTYLIPRLSYKANIKEKVHELINALKIGDGEIIKEVIPFDANPFY